MKNETKVCPECGKKIANIVFAEFHPFCSYICGFNHDERNSRHVGAYGLDQNGDYEDRESDYNYRYY